MTIQLADALDLHQAGYATIRATTDGQKRPVGRWEEYQTQRPTEDQIIDWFADGYSGIGIITGHVSGDAEMLEFEGRAVQEGILTAWVTLMDHAGLSQLRERLRGWVEQSPTGGYHIHYRVTGKPVAGNTKLARRPATDAELADNPKDKIRVLIETRGEGGFVVTAPSNGTTHPSGKPWLRITGHPSTTPTLTAAEHDALWSTCRALDTMPVAEPAEPRPTATSDGTRPGDDYNQKTDWADILTDWTRVYTHGTITYWRRPGKTIGISASTGRNDADNLYVFSTSTEFDDLRPYSKFAAYTLLHHHGDYTIAAKQLRADGYGATTPSHTATGLPAAMMQEEDTVDPGKYDDVYLARSALVDLPRGEPLIEGVLDRHTLFVISGRDRTYKSFLALDWLACLATNHDWLGRPVERTKVLYVVGEGAWGLNDRVAAWEAAWGVDIDDQWFHIRRAPVNLFRQTDAYLDLLQRLETEQYGVIIFDTLQRMSSGADQNSAKDAGIIVHALDRIRQLTKNGSVGIVAHTDKGDNDTRGSSAFEDDADIVWRTKRDEDDELIRLTQTKRKDGPDGLTLELRPNLIDGTGSLVLEQTGARLRDPQKPPKHAFEVLKMLTTPVFANDGASMGPLAETLGLRGKGSVHRALNWLIHSRYVQKSHLGRWPIYKITPEGSSQLAKIGEIVV